LGPIRGRSRLSTEKLIVRPATLRDLDTLVQQRRAMWMDLGVKDPARHHKADKTYRRWAETRMRNHQLMGWVVEGQRGAIAGGGCLWLQPIQPNPKRTKTLQPYLLSMYTNPDFRRRGVASMIVGKAIEWSRIHGYERLMLHASEMGRSVYKKSGFYRTWEMRLDLNDTRTIVRSKKRGPQARIKRA
jgi:GNAT superfamily N-acetyltransferase